MLRVVLLLLVVSLAVGCGPRSNTAPQTAADRAFAELPILEIESLENVPRVIVASARGFRDVCRDASVERVFGRTDPETGAWVEFSIIVENIVYTLPAYGYHSPGDRLLAEGLDMPNARTYYEMRRRGIPEVRYRSYFVE